MFKKIIGSILSASLIAACLCIGAVTASADSYDVYKGDTVQYIFSIGPADNVAGVAVDSWYSAEYLTPTDGVLHVGTGYVNTAYAPGAMKWNFTVYGGRSCNNDDVVTITFNVLKSGYLSDLGLSYDCVECFNHDLQDVSDNFNALVTARTVVIPTGERNDDTTDSEHTTQSDTDTNGGNDNNSSDTNSDKTTDTSSDDKKDTDLNTDVKSTDSDKNKNSDTDTSSEKNSDTASDKSTDSSTDTSRTETEITPGVNDSTDTSIFYNNSDSDTGSDKTESPNSPSTESNTDSGNSNNNNGSAVQTAGTIAVTAIALIFGGAGGLLFFMKKKEEMK